MECSGTFPFHCRPDPHLRILCYPFLAPLGDQPPQNTLSTNPINNKGLCVCPQEWQGAGRTVSYSPFWGAKPRTWSRRWQPSQGLTTTVGQQGPCGVLPPHLHRFSRLRGRARTLVPSVSLPQSLSCSMHLVSTHYQADLFLFWSQMVKKSF